MCPSYMATREEKHSTRGRAHLLFEMLQGETIQEGWKSEAVKESLDLCLACKGCKGDCPVHVDLATYKAEFLSHYHETHKRPRHAYAFGMIDRWAHLASKTPGVVNFFTQTWGLRRFAKVGAEISPKRSIPRFAKRTFTDAFNSEHRPTLRANATRVMLWPDTFNNYFFPNILTAAVEVLESVGCEVTIPTERLCCGRPLYDFGFLDRAERYLKRILDSLEKEIDAGTPVVGLEPSCVSVFRDELLNLFTHDERARRLSKQTFSLSEFLEERRKAGAQLPTLNRKVLVHSHCHHKAIMKTAALESTLKAMNVDYEMLKSGCCGMAGAFGFERDKYDVSIAVGEQVLLPAVRKADKDTIILTDGFSCREQIQQTTGRQTMHLAELIKLARHTSAE